MASPLRRLLPYHRRYAAPFWLGMLALVTARIFEAGVPYFLKVGLDRILLEDAPVPLLGAPWRDLPLDSAVGWATAGIAACVVFRFLFILLGRRVVRRIGVSVAYDLRKRVYAHLQRQGPHFYSRHPTGDLMARAINDINLIRQLIGGGLRTLGVIIVTALVGFACMFALSPGLTLLLLLPMPVIGWVGWRASRVVFARSRAVQEGFADLSEQVQENLNGIRTIHALVQEQAEIARFDTVNRAYAARYLALARINSQLQALMPWLGAWVTVVILGVGGGLVQAGEMTVGTFTAFFTYVAMVLWPVRQAGNLVTLWQQGASAAGRLYAVLDEQPEVGDGQGAVDLPEPAGALELRDLSFWYPGAGKPALADIDLAVSPGQTVAVLGRVGAGKSTLLRCLVRLLDPPRGSVCLDGVPVQDYPLAELRRRIVMVPQDPFLFAAALRDNLSYDNTTRDEVVVWQASETAALADTVRGLPAQLATEVGERGVTLSGGQKQRATLARGVIRDAAVLLLDDGFSSVDTATEEHILRELRRVRAGRTTLLVSHRVSTARHADLVLVLEDGHVVERGTHAELLAAGGWYAELERAQRERGSLADRLDAFARPGGPVGEAS